MTYESRSTIKGTKNPTKEIRPCTQVGLAALLFSWSPRMRLGVTRGKIGLRRSLQDADAQ